ncbi:MAG TPA: mechanosensitive ion channel domain-containing protein [Gammaproteobacteria bacterium]|nr:mechanosensitive ion channel domain-containing protein [Gammaproteobacteria bacterium]
MPDFKTAWDYHPFGADNVTIGQLILVFTLAIAGYGLSRLLETIVKRRLARTELRPDAAHTLQRILFYALIICVVLIALSLLNIPITAFAFLTGAIAIGVGFGAQNIINNFISGWILMAERPVRIGDFVEIDSHTGVVERIGNRSTRIRRVDGVHLLVPNSQMLERVVINWTLLDNRIRTMIRVGAAYGSSSQHVAGLIESAVTAHDDVLGDPPARIYFEDFGDNALVFDAYFWCDVSGERELRAIRSDIRHALTRSFDHEGIAIAFPQRDVHLDTSRPLQVEMVRGCAGTAATGEMNDV